MNSTARHIAHLLPYVSTLEVEGFGVFGRVVVPASYNVQTHTILPPYESVGFELAPSCGNTSWSLVSSLMRAEGFGREDAVARIAADVAQMRDELRSQGSVRLGDAGFLRAGFTGEVEFEAAPEYLGSCAGIWLPQMQLHPLQDQEAHRTTATTAAELPPAVPERRRVFGRGVRIASSWAAAIVIFAVVAFVSAMVNRWGDGSEVRMASTMAQPVAVNTPVASPAPQKPLMLVFVTPADGEDEARVRPDRTSASTEAAAAPGRDAASAADGPYFLIVASLANMDEARNFVESHSDARCPLAVVPMQGRYRVSALAGGEIAALMEQGRAQGVYDRYPNAWVCRR